MSAAEDIDTSKMHDKLDFVAIDQLAAYVDKKVGSRLLAGGMGDACFSFFCLAGTASRARC